MKDADLYYGENRKEVALPLVSIVLSRKVGFG